MLTALDCILALEAVFPARNTITLQQRMTTCLIRRHASADGCSVALMQSYLDSVRSGSWPTAVSYKLQLSLLGSRRAYNAHG